ncbi:hypothetical protein [Plasticicumulans acidivorans]|uniref:Uncharacterized protein n=1 Tax=Plasticicumulans acidivorans TaxID=886464 RepID=A0A317MT17_9GAMM|nr:hypothetical protein [Plasticicumulans acidivorans]PWV60533.1 hypothetical protein C7443_107107 [Plasticicumulans acidivorans]
MNDLQTTLASLDWAALARQGGLIWAGVLGTLLVLWLWSELMLALGGGLKDGARATLHALLLLVTVVAVPVAGLAAWHWLPAL